MAPRSKTVSSISRIGEAGIENMVEELSSGYAYQMGNDFMKTYEESIKNSISDTILQDAALAGVMSIKMTLISQAMYAVHSMVITRLVTGFHAFVAYVVGGKFLTRAGAYLGKKRLRGKRAFQKMGMALGLDDTGHRIEVGKTLMQGAIASGTSHTDAMSAAGTRAQMSQAQREVRQDFMAHDAANLALADRKIGADEKAFRYKMDYGMWQKTQHDQALYKRIMGKSYTARDWDTLVDEINRIKSANFYTTHAGHTISYAEIMGRLLENRGVTL
jgi:hypothetical protein